MHVSQSMNTLTAGLPMNSALPEPAPPSGITQMGPPLSHRPELLVFVRYSGIFPNRAPSNEGKAWEGDELGLGQDWETQRPSLPHLCREGWRSRKEGACQVGASNHSLCLWDASLGRAVLSQLIWSKVPSWYEKLSFLLEWLSPAGYLRKEGKQIMWNLRLKQTWHN